MKLNTSILMLSLPAALLCFTSNVMANQSSPATKAPTEASATATNAKSNSEIGKMVSEKLKADKRLENAKIEADVSDQGAVLLRGTVTSKQQSELASQLAATVSGVGKITNELQVPRGE